MQTRERDKVHSQFAKVRVELTWESQTASDTRKGCRYQMVKIPVGGGGQLQ